MKYIALLLVTCALPLLADHKVGSQVLSRRTSEAAIDSHDHATYFTPSPTLKEELAVGHATIAERSGSGVIDRVFTSPVTLVGREDTSTGTQSTGSEPATATTSSGESTTTQGCAASNLPGHDETGLVNLLRKQFNESGMVLYEYMRRAPDFGDFCPSYCDVVKSPYGWSRCMMEYAIKDFCGAANDSSYINSSWSYKTSTKGGRWIRYLPLTPLPFTEIYVGLEIDQTNEACKNHSWTVSISEGTAWPHCVDMLLTQIVDRCGGNDRWRAGGIHLENCEVWAIYSLDSSYQDKIQGGRLATMYETPLCDNDTVSSESIIITTTSSPTASSTDSLGTQNTSTTDEPSSAATSDASTTDGNHEETKTSSTTAQSSLTTSASPTFTNGTSEATQMSSTTNQSSLTTSLGAKLTNGTNEGPTTSSATAQSSLATSASPTLTNGTNEGSNTSSATTYSSLTTSSSLQTTDGNGEGATTTPTTTRSSLTTSSSPSATNDEPAETSSASTQAPPPASSDTIIAVQSSVYTTTLPVGGATTIFNDGAAPSDIRASTSPNSEQSSTTAASQISTSDDKTTSSSTTSSPSSSTTTPNAIRTPDSSSSLPPTSGTTSTTSTSGTSTTSSKALDSSPADSSPSSTTNSDATTTSGEDQTGAASQRPKPGHDGQMGEPIDITGPDTSSDAKASPPTHTELSDGTSGASDTTSATGKSSGGGQAKRTIDGESLGSQPSQGGTAVTVTPAPTATDHSSESSDDSSSISTSNDSTASDSLVAGTDGIVRVCTKHKLLRPRGRGKRHAVDPNEPQAACAGWSTLSANTAS